MRKLIVTVALASALAAAGTALHAEDQQGSPSSMGRDMMGQGHSMMGPTSRMMDHCGSMMQGRGDGGNRPNDQWRRRAPSAPDDNG